MASTRLFDSYPPFPDDIPIASVPKFSLEKLVSGSDTEAKELFHACRTKGFFLLDLQNDPAGRTLHQDIETLFAITQEVMDLSLEEKTKYHRKPPANLCGYKAMGLIKNDKGQPDRCEFYMVGQDDILGNKPPLASPKPISENREVFSSFVKNASPILMLVLGILDVHLGLPEGTLGSLQRPDKPSGTIVRMIRYPPKSHNDSGSALINHTDHGSITMLCTILGGLQILPPGAARDEANWQYVKPEPNCVIINLGDALVEWTAGILRSNEHRVTSPPGKQAEHVRHSLAYLVRPEHGTPMKRLRGGYIPSAAEDGKEDSSLNAEEWEMKRINDLKYGVDVIKSGGGRELNMATTKVH